ncbi:hypothetical protein BH09VER1_BH09VER1_27400 [soil metagenome]
MNLVPLLLTHSRFDHRKWKALCAALTFFVGLLLPLLPASLHAETELIANDKFSDDGASWKLSNGPKITANMSVEKVDGEQALCVAVDMGGETDGAAEPVLVRVQRLFGEVAAGKNYRVSFKAKAEKDVNIVAYVSPETDGARVLWRNEIAVGADWKEYSFTFTGRDSAPDGAFGFARLGAMTNRYWFKDIVLSED